MSTVNDKQEEAVIQEREVVASPDVQSVDEKEEEEEELEEETEEESEERESERIEERVDEKVGGITTKSRRSRSGKKIAAPKKPLKKTRRRTKSKR